MSLRQPTPQTRQSGPAVRAGPTFYRAERWDALGNLFGDRSREAEQVAAMRERVSQRPAVGNLVLVSHGVTIQALTGESLAQGEFLAVTPEGNGRFRVVGRIAASALD